MKFIKFSSTLVLVAVVALAYGTAVAEAGTSQCKRGPVVCKKYPGASADFLSASHRKLLGAFAVDSSSSSDGDAPPRRAFADVPAASAATPEEERAVAQRMRLLMEQQERGEDGSDAFSPDSSTASRSLLAAAAAAATKKASAGKSRSTPRRRLGPILNVINKEHGVVNSINDAEVFNSDGQPQGMLLQDLTFMHNDALTVGIDMRRGGVVGQISSSHMPAPFTGKNLINVWDCGRLLQQSYYGCEDGSCWASRPWRWNPVQAGSWENRPGRLLNSTVLGAGSSPKSAHLNRIVTRSHPRNWGGQEELQDVVMGSEYTLLPDALHIRYSIEYKGKHQQPAKEQEVPALFVDRRLGVLAFYEGSAPWTNGKLRFTMPGAVNTRFKPTERWAAYVDRSGHGIGLYVPIAKDLTSYRVGPEHSVRLSDTSYMAPLARFAIRPNSTFTYDVYVAVGRLADIRKTFKALAEKHGQVKPAAKPAAKPQGKPQAKPPAKKQDKPHAKQQAKPPGKQHDKPHTKPPAKQHDKPHTKPPAKQHDKPHAKPPAKQHDKQHTKPQAKPPVKPHDKQHTKPQAKPPAKPQAKPQTKPQAKPHDKQHNKPQPKPHDKAHDKPHQGQPQAKPQAKHPGKPQTKPQHDKQHYKHHSQQHNKPHQWKPQTKPLAKPQAKQPATGHPAKRSLLADAATNLTVPLSPAMPETAAWTNVGQDLGPAAALSAANEQLEAERVKGAAEEEEATHPPTAAVMMRRHGGGRRARRHGGGGGRVKGGRRHGSGSISSLGSGSDSSSFGSSSGASGVDLHFSDEGAQPDAGLLGDKGSGRKKPRAKAAARARSRRQDGESDANGGNERPPWWRFWASANAGGQHKAGGGSSSIDMRPKGQKDEQWGEQ